MERRGRPQPPESPAQAAPSASPRQALPSLSDIQGFSERAQEYSGGESRGTKCNCKNSRCLKLYRHTLYCDCFAAGGFCSPQCNCRGCANAVDSAERQESIEMILERNPRAFRPKGHLASGGADSLGGTPVRAGGGNGIHQHAVDPVAIGVSRGCNCRKSGCLKKYCECFQAGVPCTRQCRCIDCCNTGEDSSNISNPLEALASAAEPLRMLRSPAPASAPPYSSPSTAASRHAAADQQHAQTPVRHSLPSTPTLHAENIAAPSPANGPLVASRALKPLPVTHTSTASSSSSSLPSSSSAGAANSTSSDASFPLSSSSSISLPSSSSSSSSTTLSTSGAAAHSWSSVLDRADCAPEWHSLWQQTGTVLETTAHRPFGGAQGKRQHRALAALLSDEAVRRVGVRLVAAARREESEHALSSSSSSSSSFDEDDAGAARGSKRGKIFRESDEHHDDGGDDVSMDDRGGRPDDLLCTDSLSDLRGADAAADYHAMRQRAVLRELGAFAEQTLQSVRAPAAENGAMSAAIPVASPSASILASVLKRVDMSRIPEDSASTVNAVASFLHLDS